ncbi:MAG: isoprenylcysteine carboxylmethyltransferase family protein [Desulfobacterales bacterium]|nr:isoprenylcysteine carboxylmethyltransferase family protein [Desulfobacterales bacterium]MBF0397783.1 isoprenylcysteine carboxylmethyltransferase family protein [Desulfobacterales bacterium]
MNNNRTAYIIIYMSLFFGITSLLVFSAFLLVNPQSIVDIGLSETGKIFFNTFLSLLFFLQHSIMIRNSFRKKAETFFNPVYYNAFFSIASGIVLLITILFWQKSSLSLATTTGIYCWIFYIFFFIAIAGFIWGSRALLLFDPFGIKKILYHLRGKQHNNIPFVINGPYKYVRHPLYFFMLIMIWASPDLTPDRLLFNIIWTIWIYWGAKLEENDLVNEFGNKYQEYQKNVPMIFPFRCSLKKYKVN